MEVEVGLPNVKSECFLHSIISLVDRIGDRQPGQDKDRPVPVRQRLSKTSKTRSVQCRTQLCTGRRFPFHLDKIGERYVR